MLEVDRKAEIEVLSSAIAATEAHSPDASQRSQPGPFVPLGSQLLPDSQDDLMVDIRPPSQLMQYLFGRIGARLDVVGKKERQVGACAMVSGE